MACAPCSPGKDKPVKEENKVLLVGLDGTGKSTIFKSLINGHHVTTTSTERSSECVATFCFNDIHFTLHDVNEQAEILNHWMSNLPDTKALIFVVDSSEHNSEKIENALFELTHILSNEEIKDAALLVFANKQDLADDMDESAIIRNLQLASLNHRDWFVQGTIGTKDDTMIDGLDWLATQLKNRQ